MAHLLVVESWVGSMSRLLPRAIRESGHEFTFLTRDLHHYLRSAPEGAAHPLLGARNVVTADTNDIDELLPYVEKLHAVLGFDGVITSCDYYLPTVARIAGHLGLPGSGPEAVENACRKDATRRVLADAGVPGPRFAVCEEWADIVREAREIGYPLVVKPVDLCAGMYVRRVDDEAQLAEACRALSDFPVNARGQRRPPVVLLEEFLDGPEVSVETVSYAGAVHVVGVTDKSIGGAPAFIETGHMFPAALTAADTEAAEQTALGALKALGLVEGVVAHTEIKLTSVGPRVVEVDPARPATASPNWSATSPASTSPPPSWTSPSAKHPTCAARTQVCAALPSASSSRKRRAPCSRCPAATNSVPVTRCWRSSSPSPGPPSRRPAATTSTWATSWRPTRTDSAHAPAWTPCWANCAPGW